MAQTIHHDINFAPLRPTDQDRPSWRGYAGMTMLIASPMEKGLLLFCCPDFELLNSI
jgi:hypothetical protein